MPIHLKSGFADYINKLQIKSTSKDHYRKCMRWIERYGSGDLDLKTIRTKNDIADFVDRLAQPYNDAHPTGLRFNKDHGYDVKCIIRHYLKFLQADELTVVQEQLEEEGAFKSSNQKQGKEKALQSIALRRGQPKFRNALLIAYEGKCAVTETAIEDVLEAAHIIPYNGDPTNHISNGLLLRCDIHALFDLGLLSVDPKTLSVYCSEQIRHEAMYKELHGKKLKMPAKPNEQPNNEVLRKHFDKREA